MGSFFQDYMYTQECISHDTVVICWPRRTEGADMFIKSTDICADGTLVSSKNYVWYRYAILMSV